MAREKKEVAMGKWIALDGGTTHTRIRLMQGETIVSEIKCAVGAGDTARAGSIAPLRDGVRAGIESVLADGGCAAADVTEIIASGMIGSELGLHKVDYISDEVNVTALATQGDTVTLPEITPIPFYFVPGVRNGGRDRMDLMRGEETECLGLLSLMDANGLTCSVLLPGSHNKLVRVTRGRIMACYTAMSGEALSAIATQTLLKSALPAKWPLPLKTELKEGYQDAETFGLMHALFHVRLMQTQMRTTAEQRFSYFLGAGLSGDVRLIRAFSGNGTVIIAGTDPMKTALADLVGAFCENPIRLADADTAEMASVAGARRIRVVRSMRKV